MSDYGFKTLDKTNAVVVNAKYPIFGFDMGHKPRAYKTFHFTDSASNPITSGNVSVPSLSGNMAWRWGQSVDSGIIRQLITKVKHGYNFRPVGYATITGVLQLGLNIGIEQDEVAATSSFGGDYSLETTKTQFSDVNLLPSRSGHIDVGALASTLNFAAPSAFLTASDFAQTIWAYPYVRNVITGSPYGASDTDNPAFGGTPDPIEVEIDDEYIYFYRTYWWSDTLRRVAYFNNAGTATDDLRERVRIATQYVGSTYDVTVYLCPFPLDELLHKAKTHIDPTRIAIWDVDYWDGGKVWG